MATVSGTLRLFDGVTGPLRSISNALQVTIDSFESLHNASSDAIDTQALAHARRELDSAIAQFGELEGNIRSSEQSQRNLNNSIRDGTDAAGGLLGKIVGIATAYLSFQSVKGILAISDQLTNTNARLDLMNDGLQTTVELQDKIHASANRTYSSFSDTADMIAKLGILAGDAFKNNDEIIGFAEQLNKHFVISGTEAQGVQAVMLQLTQAMAGGVLRGEELNSVFENAPTLIQNISDYLGVTKGEIRDLASEGLITADIVKKALFAAADETNQKFESMPNTFKDVWNVAINDIIHDFNGLFERIRELINSEGFQSFVDDAVSYIGTFSNVAITAIDTMASIASFAYENWSLIAPIIGTATAAMIAYGTALLILKGASIAQAVWLGIKTLAMGLYTATTWASVQATLAATGAAWGLNAALYANPIFWVIMAVIALIGVLYLAVGIINHFAGTSISATGIVAGVFATLGVFIFNIVAYLWNIFAALAEFFVNVWRNPVYSVKRLFANLTNNVLDMAISMTSGWDSFATSFVNAIISAVNGAIKAWNWFVDLLPDDISGKLGLSKGGEISHRTSITSDLSAIKSGIDVWLGDTPEDYWEAPKMNMKSLGAAWDTGYNWGANAFSSNEQEFNTKGMEDAIANAMKGVGDGLGSLGDALDKDGKNGKKTAGNTAKMADSIDSYEEDIKLLRELAEMKSIQNFVTLTPTLQVQTGDIRETADIQELIAKLEQLLAEQIAESAKGVYS